MKAFFLIFTFSFFIIHAQNHEKDFYKETKRITLYPEGIPCKSDFETVVDYNSTGRTFKKIADPEIWYFPSKINNDNNNIFMYSKHNNINFQKNTPHFFVFFFPLVN